MSNFVPSDLGLDIFNDRYTINPEETYDQASLRLASFVSTSENNSKQWTETFYAIIRAGAFMPGGRIWYGCGRPVAQLNNCFVIPTEDSREGWAKMVGHNIIIAGTGGGLGENYSSIRPRGTKINGTGGFASGAISIMRIENAALEEIRAGSSRRAARMFALNINHPDIMEFVHAKMDLGQLNNGNASIIFDFSPIEFFEKVDNDLNLDLIFQGTVRSSISARELWQKILTHALANGEPGILNGYRANEDNNIDYCRKLICTNPCFSGDTIVLTSDGHFPIQDLVGKTTKIWDGNSWVITDSFRKTAVDQETNKITLQDGSVITATPYHKFILTTGQRVELKDLIIGDQLEISLAPETHGSHNELGAYGKGFLIGDGSLNQDTMLPMLYLYAPKYQCEERLIHSFNEIIKKEKLNTNAINSIGFITESLQRKRMRGLTSLSENLIPWTTKYRYKLPPEIYAWNKRSKLEFIAGMLDSDGSIMDSNNGFGYQISSVYKECLLGLQTLLKTIGVYSKVARNKSSGIKDFGDRWGFCEVRELWRLTVSQKNSIILSNQITFSRLNSLADRHVSYNLKPKWNTIVNIEQDVKQDVYCCTILTNHSFCLTNGIRVGQCGEQWLHAYSSCCLGALVLPRFLKTSKSKNFKDKIDWEFLHHSVSVGIRFLDDVLSVSYYPLPEIKQEAFDTRRIGLGIMGLHYMLIQLGFKYSSAEGRDACDKIGAFIKHAAYDTSVGLASEKGPFPLWDASKAFTKSNFISRLKPSMKSKIKLFGLRNCSLLTIAPTGTTGMVQGVSTGIEPIFAPAYNRRFYKDGIKTSSLVVDPLFREMVLSDQDVTCFESASDISPWDHLNMQATWQEHIDNAVSKTINIPRGEYTTEKLDLLYREFLPRLKGLTIYPEGSREDEPLERLSMDIAINLVQTQNSETSISDDCRTGNCII